MATHASAAARRRSRSPLVINIQDCGGIAKTVEAGVKAVTKLLGAANELRRTRQPVSKLIVAENCGGSEAKRDQDPPAFRGAW